MRYYVMEVQNVGAFAKAEAFEAKSCASAKRAASRKQVFQGTVLYLGTEVDSNGFVRNPIAVKEGKDMWRCNVCATK